MSNVIKIKNFDTANGEGIRTSIFFSGCEFKCKGCFNSEAWDFNKGEEFTYELYKTKIKPTINEHIAGISILGGEPLHPKNILATSNLVKWFKRDFHNKNVWLWTGYAYEDIIKKPYTENLVVEGNIFKAISLKNIIKNIDILVDGQYIEEQRDLTLKWRGSRNQRVINVQESLKQNKIVKYCK